MPVLCSIGSLPHGKLGNTGGSPYGQVQHCCNKDRGCASRTAAMLRTLLMRSHHGAWVRIGCDRCKENFTCIYSDDLARISSALDTADAVLVVVLSILRAFLRSSRPCSTVFSPTFGNVSNRSNREGRCLLNAHCMWRSLAKGEIRMAPLLHRHRSHLLLLLRIFQWLTRVISSLSMKIRSFLKHCR